MNKYRINLMNQIQQIFKENKLDYKKVQNTYLWESEKSINGDLFSFSTVEWKRIGYQPLRPLSRGEIVKINKEVLR